MGLRSLGLGHEYRSDRDDIVSGFFVPCLSNSTEYNRCVEYVSAKSLTTLALGLGLAQRREARLRVISGHRFAVSDLSVLSGVFAGRRGGRSGSIRDSKTRMLAEAVGSGRLELKVAVPGSEEVDGAFAEKFGVFADEAGDMVAFTGTSSRTFDRQNRDFESVDVYTSWAEPARVSTKLANFDGLWADRTRYVDVYDFASADAEGVLKYSSDWASG